jgi:psiF repeat
MTVSRSTRVFGHIAASASDLLVVLELVLMRLIILFLALTIGSAAHAATISVKPAANGEPALVTVDGNLQANDGDQFRSKTSFLSKAIVSFRSDGGSVVAGIRIGESIRLKGFTTVVAGNARCASACAIAWLGGTPRIMGAEARVGFHAAYSSETGQETGVGNALVGAYLSRIGLPYSAVIYITQAAPNSMTWLSIVDAEKQGIDVEPLGSGKIVHILSHGQINQNPEAPPAVRNGPLSVAEMTAISRECSDQATARSLHGYERKAFRAECMKRLGWPGFLRP